MSNKIPVAVLAGTGSVGQRMISLLDGHPWFEVVEVTASERSEGKRYQDACHWFLSKPMPEYVKDMVLLPTKASALSKAKIVFSALPADIAKEIEPDFAKAGMYLSSNASAYRKDPLVPLLVPEINPEHLDLIALQHSQYGWSGGIITNPNCTTTGFVIPLHAIDQKYHVKQLFAFSMQALSGAGIPGVPSLDIIDNVIPYIGGEEEKSEKEPLKIWGHVEDGHIVNDASVAITTQCLRVPVSDGHMAAVFASFEKKPEIEEIKKAWAEYQGPELVVDGKKVPMSEALPSAPKLFIHYFEEPDRPQTRLDRNLENGMAVSAGRLREDSQYDIKFVCLSHNTLRGAAGGGVELAELLAVQGYLD